MTKPRHTPARDAARATAEFFKATTREAFDLLTDGDRDAIAWELFTRAQAEVEAGRLQSLDAEISRHLDRPEPLLFLDAAQVDAILRSVPADTELVLRAARAS